MGYVVHNPGTRMHYTSAEMDNFLPLWANSDGEPITNGMAQTIAAWYHSPACPNSTRLSTKGEVTSDMSIHDFADPAQYDLDSPERLQLTLLDEYIRYYQVNPSTPAGYVFCACEGCFEEIVGRQGEMCPRCDDSGCDPDDGYCCINGECTCGCGE